MKLSQRFIIIAALFITCLITANVIAVKVAAIGQFYLPAAIVVFPLSYVFGDILTEVYGYSLTRRVIWLGFLCNFIFVIFALIGQALPSAPFWTGQDSYITILGYTPVILLASFTGYLAGEFANSFILARMKLLTQGRWLWTRTISSTMVGQALDTSFFILIAFWGTPALLTMILSHWIAKVIIEAAFTPITYLVVNYLKQKESVDTFDYKTNFNPFSIAE